MFSTLDSLILFLIVFLATLLSQFCIIIIGFILEYYKLRKSRKKMEELSKKFSQELSKNRPKDK